MATEAGNCFGIQESASFARALAKNDGIQIQEVRGSVVPYSTADGTIVVGKPSLYSPKEYMGALHREISKQVPKMSKLFMSTEEKEGSLRHLAKAIIQEQRTEYEDHGRYEGRDRVLSDAYGSAIQGAGGLQEILKHVPPPIAALLYHGNELRNQWQGYIPSGPVPPGLEELVENTKVIKDKWLSLETPKELDELLQFLTEQSQGGGDGQGDGHSTEGSGEAGGSSGGEQNPGDETGEGKGEGAGDDQGSEGDAQDSPGEGQGDGEDEEGAGESKESQKDTGDTGGNEFSEAYSFLKDSDLLKPPQKYGERAPEVTHDPYTCTRCYTKDLTALSHIISSQGREIEGVLGSFSLSKKIRKYLLATSQTGYEYGLKRGKLVNKKISSLYAASETQEPRIFKQRRSTKIQVDSAVFILGDCSGSMDGQKYEMSSACQIAMSEVLQGLRIPHKMLQFTTRGSDRVHYVMKNFEELNVSRDKLLGRYGSSLIRMSSNADGEAVMEASQVLLKRPEKNKVLLVLSDGQPAFQGADKRYLKDATKIIESSGLIHLYGIGIMDDSVKKYYKDHKVVEELEELEHVLMDLLSKNILK